jgi:hypothetical protein
MWVRINGESKMMKHLVLAIAISILGFGAASADYHKDQPPGPERGQGLSGHGAESSGGKSTDAISKAKGEGKHGRTDSDSHSDSFNYSDTGKKAKKDKKDTKANKDK